MRTQRIKRIMLTFGIALSLVGCSGKTEDFVRETHARDEYITRNFEMMTLKDGNVSYHIEMNKEDVENGNLKVYEELLTEVKKAQQSIEELAGDVLKEQTEETIDVYFLENTDNYKGWGNAIVIEKDYIMTEELTYHLLGKLYDCEEWVAYGLSRYLLGGTADEDYIKEYYSKKKNIEDLSLFGAKLYDLNPSEEEKKAVRETALSLFSYVLREKDVAILFDMSESSSEQLMQWKNDWMQAMDISGVYNNEREEIVRQLRFLPENGRYPVLMKFENFVFYLDDTMFNKDRMETMDGVEKEFLWAFEDVIGIQEYLNENLSEDLLQNIQDRKQYFTKCYFKKEESNISNAHVKEWKIRLSDIHVFPHESVHAILLDSSNSYERDRQWISEGLADYLAIALYGKNKNRVVGAWYEEYYLNWDASDVVDNVEHEITRNHNKKVFDIYLSEGGKWGENDFDYERFTEIYLYTEKCISNPEDKPWVKANSISGVYGMKIKNGTGDWSYDECREFIEYLVERFGIQKVVEVNYEPERIEEILGDTLLNLHSQWEEAFMEENAGLAKYAKE